MEWALLAIICALAVAAGVWVYKAGAASRVAEALEDSNEGLNSRLDDVNAALLQATENERREDRLRADEIVRTRDADAAFELLRNAAGNKPD